MLIIVQVEIEVEHRTGKFAPKSEIEDQVLEIIASSDPGEVDGDEGGNYEVVTWNAELDTAAMEAAEAAMKRARRERRKARRRAGDD